MNTDPIVLANDYILHGDDIGKTRPNDNVLVVGCSGTGKSTSICFPTICRSNLSNPIFSCAKPSEGYEMAIFLQEKGYDVDILDICSPQNSTCSFDPIKYIKTQADITALASSIVNSVIKKANDDYWSIKAVSLLGALIAGSIMENNYSMMNVLKLFDGLRFDDESLTRSGSTFQLFENINRLHPDSFAAREFRAFISLPYKTCSCLRDTLASCLETVFPEGLRSMMNQKPLSFEKLSTEKHALIIITSTTDRWQEYFVNLFFRSCIRELLFLAEYSPQKALKRPVRLYFSDFACSCPIDGFESDLSIMRSAGISVLIQLQSQSQLECIYGSDKAAIIRQNCPVQVYFPGGFDIKSCEIVSKAMNISIDKVLYGDMGNVFVMQAGKLPGIYPRYDTLNSQEYIDFCQIQHRRRRRPRAR